MRLSPTPIISSRSGESGSSLTASIGGGESSYIEVLEVFPNVGPIGDALIQEVQGSTQVCFFSFSFLFFCSSSLSVVLTGRRMYLSLFLVDRSSLVLVSTNRGLLGYVFP